MIKVIVHYIYSPNIITRMLTIYKNTKNKLKSRTNNISKPRIHQAWKLMFKELKKQNVHGKLNNCQPIKY